MTMRRSHQSVGLTGTLRDADKMDKLRKELHTDDEGNGAAGEPCNLKGPWLHEITPCGLVVPCFPFNSRVFDQE